MSVDLRRPTLFLCSCKYKYIKEQGRRTVLKASRRWRFKGWLCLGHVCCILVRKLGLMLLPITVLFCILVNLGVGLSADRGRLFFFVDFVKSVGRQRSTVVWSSAGSVEREAVALMVRQGRTGRRNHSRRILALSRYFPQTPAH